jgi:hypothetical protein
MGLLGQDALQTVTRLKFGVERPHTYLLKIDTGQERQDW